MSNQSGRVAAASALRRCRLSGSLGPFGDLLFAADAWINRRNVGKGQAGDGGGRKERKREHEPGLLQPGDRGCVRTELREVRAIGCGNIILFLNSKLAHSFSFTSGISSYPHHGYNGCRYCGFFTGCSGRTDPCCTHTTSPARFVEQVRRRRGRDTDNNRTDRRSGAFGRILWEDRATE